MSRKEAIEALRLAGTANSEGDSRLGRFGLGLKTASLSQGKKLSVLTKQNDMTTCLSWDIDYVKKTKSWSLQEVSVDEYEKLPLWENFKQLSSGTLVVLEKLDAIIGDSEEPGQYLAEKISSLASHLGLTFHRFLLANKSRLYLSINGAQVMGIDPFLTSNSQTQISPIEKVPIGESFVKFRSYTLPHPSGLSLEEKKRYDLSDGMRESQGFYVYRNNRLISKGHWFGLARMNEITKQTRIEVDIPREVDSLWQLDIKKSRTEPPASFKNLLRRMINPLLERGRRLHTFRGRKESSDQISHIWNKIKLHEGFKYEINLDNPVIRATLSSLDSAQAEQMAQLFETIANNYPFLDVYQEMAANNQPSAEDASEEEIISKLIKLRMAEIFNGSATDVTQQLKLTEPFSSVNNLEELVHNVWEPNGRAK
jgi:hypothetical protein